MQDDSSLVLVHEGFSGEGREASIFGRYLEEEKEGAGGNLVGKPGEFFGLKSKKRELQGAGS